MGHDLYPNNEKLEKFHMGLAWSHLLEQCGSYFTYVSLGARWYMVHDERMTTHFHDLDEKEDGERAPVIDKQYPAIICNCGFEITEEEARVLARIARNYAAIQRTVEEPSEEDLNIPISTPDYLKPFPRYIRRDWVELFEQFAKWAEQSNGFKVY